MNYMDIVSDLQGKLYEICPKLSEEYVGGFELRYSGFVEQIYFNGVLIYDTDGNSVYNYEEDREYTVEELEEYLVLKSMDICNDFLYGLRKLLEAKEAADEIRRLTKIANEKIEIIERQKKAVDALYYKLEDLQRSHGHISISAVMELIDQLHKSFEGV